jgi:hypothetical protein
VTGVESQSERRAILVLPGRSLQYTLGWQISKCRRQVCLLAGRFWSDGMATLIKVADSLMNIRGNFKVGPLDVGTQASLVKRKSGKWLMLDAGARRALRTVCLP